MISSQTRQTRLVVFGVALHALLIYAMFDVHFLTPLVHDIEPTIADFAAPASRLVIIVADGLRGDRLFEMEDASDPDTTPRTPRAPFLHGIAESHGRWGISHARPPTESRPGHVALLAGFYEDPSAITKGWQANAVEFDHLLNQSSSSWALGAPSVVPLFARNIKHVRHRMYGPELEDFAASSDHAALDTWVFDATRDVLIGNVSLDEFENGATIEKEASALQGHRVVFLLHLLGLDSAGHAHKPAGDAYARNVKVVDDGVRELVAAFEKRFASDNRTTFVFTADHGMSARGAHGDGDPECTETPLVVWGAGIAVAAADADAAAAADPACASRGKNAPTPEQAWGLSDKNRCDVDQADVASLCASVLGMPPPLHNTGLVPVAYLDPHLPQLRSGAAVANAAQLLAVYRRKTIVTASKSLRAFLAPNGLKPYGPLALADETLAAAKDAREAGNHDAVIAVAQTLARDCVDGTNYLHLYDRWLLMGVITSCFVGWIGVLCAELCLGGAELSSGEIGKGRSRVLDFVALVVSCVACFVLALRQAPVTYYAYFNLPVLFARHCWHAFARTKTAGGAKKITKTPTRHAQRLLVLLVTAALTQTLCRAFHDRAVFTGLFAVTAAWLLVWATWTAATLRGDRAARAASAAALVAALGAGALAPFMSFSIDLEANPGLVLVGVACTAAIATFAHFALRPLDLFGDDPSDEDGFAAGGKRRPGYALLVVQLSLLWCAGLVVLTVDGLRGAMASIPGWLHLCAWVLASGAAPLPLLSPNRTLPRFVSVFLACATAYALFSVSYESLFYAALGAACLAWLVLERFVQKMRAVQGSFPGGGHKNKKNVVFERVAARRGANVGDARHAVVFLTLINAAFFGTGNIASVASFEISSVYRFTTKFNPFLMGGLLVLKVLIPMTTVAVAFLALLKLQAVRTFQLYLIFIALSDAMAITFWFQVTTTGSWQDIGMSISRYALMGTQVVTVLVFLGLADMYTRALPVNGVRASVDLKKKR